MQTPTQKKRPPRWRRTLLGVVIGILVLVLALVLIASFFNKQISRKVLDELGKSLKTEVQVGDANLSLLSGFPNASVNLTDVRVKDAFGGYLLAAREVAFRFKISSLFADRIEVKDMRISGGGIRVRITERGQVNYDIFKESSSESSELRIALENAQLKNLLLSFQNARTKQTAEINLRSAGFAGDFSADKFNLSSQADCTVSRLQVNKNRYMLGETLRYDAVIAVDLSQGLYDLQRVDLTVGGNTFAVAGIAVDKPEHTDLNLKLTGKEGDVSVLFDLLPEPYHSYFNDFQSSGTYDCTAFVKGRAGRLNTPTVGVELALRNGQLFSEKLQSPLRQVSFRATYSAAPGGSGVFEVADFQGTFGGEPLSLQLKVTNLDDPVVNFQCHGALPLASAYGLLNSPDVRSGEGLIRLNSLSVQGRYADMISMGRINAVRVSGEVQFDGATVVYKDVPVSLRSGRLSLTDNTFRLDSLFLQAGNSDFSLNGSAQNLLPVLFADSLNTAGSLLEFNARLNCNQLDLTQLIELFSIEEDDVDGGQVELDSLRTAGNVERQQLTDKLQGVFEATIGHIQYENIGIDQFFGRLAFDHNKLVINGDGKTMRGQVNLEGIAYFAISPTLQMRITAENIDLQTCFEQCNNFGQSVITDKNMRGQLTGRIILWAFWNERNEFLLDKLRAYADVYAANGQLQNVKMLEDFSSFVHIEDLRHIEFTNLQNYLEINGGKLYLPTMFIQNNALNMTLSGVHTFENKIDYKIKVNVGQTLWNRLKKHDSDFEPLPKKNGWFNAYYSIVGTVDDYEMVKGKKSVKAAFEASEARKRIIAEAVEREFAGGAYRRPLAPPEDEFLDEIIGGSGRPK